MYCVIRKKRLGKEDRKSSGGNSAVPLPYVHGRFKHLAVTCARYLVHTPTETARRETDPDEMVCDRRPYVVHPCRPDGGKSQVSRAYDWGRPGRGEATVTAAAARGGGRPRVPAEARRTAATRRNWPATPPRGGDGERHAAIAT
jgi:hypothetical protein